MKVLYIRSGNGGIDPISTRQGESLRKVGVDVEYYDIIGKGLGGYLYNIFKLRKYIKSLKPDLLHAHYSLSGIVTTLTFSHIPIVVSLMGSDVQASNLFIKFTIRVIKPFWKSTIVKSEEMYLKLGYKKAFIVPNGVDFNNFYPLNLIEAREKLNWNQNKKQILFASNPNRPEKNFALAELALKQLKKEKIDFELHFLTNIPMNNMVLYYNAADLLLLTSYYEGSPNVIKEAMACNCPIVATNVGDVSKVIGNTKNSHVTSFDDLDVFHKIKEVILTNQRSDGRNNIEDLRCENIAKKLLEIYKSN